MKTWSLGCCGLVLMLVASGCSTPVFRNTIFDSDDGSVQSNGDRRIARMANETQQLTAEVTHLREEDQDLKRQQQQLEERLAQSEKQGGTREDITALRKDVQMLRAERDTLKREISDDLMSRIDKAAARAGSTPSSSNSAARTSMSTRMPTTKKSGATTRTGYEHTVVKGQTLSEIARGYGKSIDSIMKANKISNPASIRIGQVLFIPD